MSPLIPDLLKFDRFEIFKETMASSRDISSRMVNKIGESLGDARIGTQLLQRDSRVLANNESHCTRTAKVIAPDERGVSAWLGGSILAQLSTFEPMCIKNNSGLHGWGTVDANRAISYDDVGPHRAHQMFDSHNS